ncbi:hypothetical protein GGR57DRAFT_516334 [Xylariaceae sp. FL1272]|nr:hypothetical protein GGR57DRAFT_516334 [Xylariaceae sp. FL1272]
MADQPLAENVDEFQAIQQRLEAHVAPQHERYRVDGVISAGANGVTLRVLELEPDMPAVEQMGKSKGLKRKLKDFSTRSWGNVKKKFAALRVDDADGNARAIAEEAALFEGSPEPMGRRVVRRMCVKLPLDNPNLNDPIEGLRFEINTLRAINGVIRACVALLYPKAFEPDTKPELEILPQPGREASGIEHRDVGVGNIMIGDLDPSLREHSLLPTLKMIDFGEAREEEPPEDAASSNLADVSRVILTLITGQVFDFAPLGQWQGIQTTASRLIPRAGNTPYPHLDGEMRNVICRTLATDWDLRMPLAEAYDIVTRGANKGHTAYLLSNLVGGTLESDDDLRNFVQEFILNPA